MTFFMYSNRKVLPLYLSTLIGFIVGFVNQKIYANQIELTEFSKLGNFINYFQIISLVSIFGINLGIINLISQNLNNPEILKKIIFNSLVLCIIGSLLSTLFLIVIYLINIIEISSPIFLSLILCILPISLSQLGFSLLSGYRELKWYIFFQITLHVFNLILTYFLTKSYALQGAVASVYLPTTLTCFFMLIYFFVNKNKYKPFYLFDNTIIKKLLNYSLMSGFIIFLLPLSYITIRHFIETNYSEVTSGYWQSTVNLSRFAITFITAIIPIYFIPKVNELRNQKEIKNELKKIFYMFTVFTTIYLLIVISFGENVLSIIYSDKFKPANKLYILTTIGDAIRIIAIPYAYLLISRSKMYKYIAFEMFYYLTLTVLSIFATNRPIEYVALTYIITSILYLLMLLLDYKINFINKNENITVG